MDAHYLKRAPIVIPVTAGAATGYVSMKIWNKIFSKTKKAKKTKTKA